jgi:DNA primase
VRTKTSTGASRFQAFPAETIEAVRALSPIEQIISERVRLRRSGAQLLGRCPFHADKSPSFSVNPAKQVFHCHGCGAGGDVFQFVCMSLQCRFRDSVAHLAERAGIHLYGSTPSPELRELVARQKAEEAQRRSFEQFANAWIDGVCREYRALARAATHAEDCLRAGTLDAVEQEMAWGALERYRLFEIRVEREGLCDPEVIRGEWAKRSQDAARAA